MVVVSLPLEWRGATTSWMRLQSNSRGCFRVQQLIKNLTIKFSRLLINPFLFKILRNQLSYFKIFNLIFI